MKKLLTLILLLSIYTTSNGQSISEIKKYIEIEHYGKAQLLCEAMQKTDAEAAYLLAEILLVQGKLPEAKEVINTALQTFKDNILIQVAYAHHMLYEGKKAEAKTLFAQCLSKAGNKRTDILIAAGKAYAEVPLRVSDPDDGIAILKEALTLQPTNGMILIYMGDCYMKKIDYGNAFLQYGSAISADAKLTAIAKYKIGNLFKQQKNCDVLTSSYTGAVTANPKFMPAWRELYYAHAFGEGGCNNNEKAETYYRSYITNAEPGLQTEIIKIKYLYINKDYSGVIQKVKEIQNQMPGKAPVSLYATAASAYLMQKDYLNTITWMENYLKAENAAENLKPFHYSTLAEAYSATGKYQLAKEAYMKCAFMQTDVAVKTSFFGKAAGEAHKANDYSGEASAYKLMVDNKKAPSAADYYMLGTAYFNGHNYSECKKVFQRYGEVYPNDWRAPLWLGNTEGILDSTMTTGAAAPHFEKFITLAKSDPTAKTSLIRAHLYLFAYEYQLKKNLAAADAHLDNVLALDPANADVKKYKKLLGK